MYERASEPAGARAIGFDWGPLLLTLFALAMNAPQLAARVVPIHDTFYSFVNFHVFYNELFFAGDLPHWLPYCEFGLPADLQQIISLTPMSYLVGLVGSLARVEDALLLFKLSVIGEQLVFVIGTYALSRRLFSERATALALGVAAAGTVVWTTQLWFELRFFYALPWVLYCAVSFLERGGPAWLWLAGVVSVAWALGSVPYFLPLWALILLLCLAPAALGQPVAWSRLRSAGPHLLLLALFAAGAGVYVYFTLHALDSLVMDVPGRNPVTSQVDVETFRSYGGRADLATVARSFLLGRPIHLPWGSGADNSVYVGLLPLVGFAWAVARERSRLFLGLLAALVALVWLSLGGIFATAVYYLPGLSQYRHVGLVYGLVKTLGILAAGYGLERLWALPLRLPSRRLLLVGAGGLALASVLVVPALASAPFALRLWLYALALAASLALTRSPQAGLVVGLALDLALYQSAVARRRPLLPPAYEERLDALRVHELRYQAQRYPSPAQAPRTPETERAARALSLAERPGAKELYWVTYGFAQFDPCESRYWSEMNASGVERLLELEQTAGRPLRELRGCGAPKLRLVAGATVVEDAEAARDALLAGAASGGPIPDVIRVPPGGERPAASGPWQPEAGEVRVERFGLDELVAQVHVSAPAGAWLVYADALYPGWRATVDGREVPIAEANLAFKAVWLPSGDHTVAFSYRRGPSHAASYALAGFGLASSVLFLAGFACATFPGLRFRRDRQRDAS